MIGTAVAGTDEVPQTFGAFLTKLRTDAGIPFQREAGSRAERLGIDLDAQRIRNFEINKTKSLDPDDLRALAKLYKVSPALILRMWVLFTYDFDWATAPEGWVDAVAMVNDAAGVDVARAWRYIPWQDRAAIRYLARRCAGLDGQMDAESWFRALTELLESAPPGLLDHDAVSVLEQQLRARAQLPTQSPDSESQTGR
jgi:hypothetical protein